MCLQYRRGFPAVRMVGKHPREVWVGLQEGVSGGVAGGGVGF